MCEIILGLLCKCICDDSKKKKQRQRHNNPEDDNPKYCCGKMINFIFDASPRVSLVIFGVVYTLLITWATVGLPRIFGSGMMYDEVGTDLIFGLLFFLPGCFVMMLLLVLLEKLTKNPKTKKQRVFAKLFKPYSALMLFLPWTMYLLAVYDKDLIERLAGTIKVEDAQAIAEANKFVEPFFVFKNGYIDEEPDACYQNMHYTESDCWSCDGIYYDHICPIVPSKQGNITCEDIVGWYGFNDDSSTFGYRYSPNCDGFCVSGEIRKTLTGKGSSIHSLPTLEKDPEEHTQNSVYHDCNFVSELPLYKPLKKRFVDETPMDFNSRCLLFAFNFLFVVVGSYLLCYKRVERNFADDVSVAEVISEVEFPERRTDADRDINDISVAEVVAKEECPDRTEQNITI
jgi:hypothetical protein